MVYRWRLLVQTIRILTAGRPRDFIFNPWHIGAADTLKFWNHQIPAIVYQNWYTIMMACSFTLPIQPFPRECSAIYVHPMPWKSEKNCLYHSKPYQSGDNHPLLWLYYAIYIYSIQSKFWCTYGFIMISYDRWIWSLIIGQPIAVTTEYNALSQLSLAMDQNYATMLFSLRKVILVICLVELHLPWHFRIPHFFWDKPKIQCCWLYYI